MKQAIIITVYKNVDYLKEIIQVFDEDFLFYVHVDKKSTIENSKLDELLTYPNVVLATKKYRINWGGTNFLKANLFLIDEALKNEQIEYFHVLSGQDFPVKNCLEIKSFIARNKGKEFLEFLELPDASWDMSNMSNGGEDRMVFYHLYDIFNVKLPKRQSLLNKFLVLQKRIGLSRKIPGQFLKLYGGSVFCTLTRPCVDYLVRYNKENPSFLKRLAFTYCPEEIYFHSIIMNSPFRKNVVNDNLRYILWENRNGNNPANLDESDYENILKSNKLFARKFEHPFSDKLRLLIKQHISKTFAETKMNMKNVD